MFHISDLMSNIGDFARPYLFYCTVGFPGGITQLDAITQARYLVKSTNLPASVIPPIQVAWQGQTFKFGSTHEIQDWTVTFNCDADGGLRSSFTNWAQIIHNLNTNSQGSPNTYMGDVALQLLDGNGNPTMEYVLYGAWPNNVGELMLDYANKTATAEFQVTFSYQYHNVITYYNESAENVVLSRPAI